MLFTAHGFHGDAVCEAYGLDCAQEDMGDGWYGRGGSYGGLTSREAKALWMRRVILERDTFHREVVAALVGRPSL